MRSLHVLFAVVAAVRAAPEECAAWARGGECNTNAAYMQEHCAEACRKGPQMDALGEPEQCAGWAAQGECTRNPKHTTRPNLVRTCVASMRLCQ
jgi:hypothetical protein